LLSDIYLRKTQQWQAFLGGNGGDQSSAVEAMESSLSTLKIIRRLLIVGYEYPNHDKDVQQFWAQSQQHFGEFLNLITCQPPVLVSPALELVEKHLLQFSKLHTEMASTHAAAFALLPNSLELARGYWGLIEKFGDEYGSEAITTGSKALGNSAGGKADRPVMERLALKGLVLMRLCLKMVFSPKHSFKYRSPEIKEEQAQAVKFLETQLLTPDLVGQMANTVVTKFFVFRQKDLEEWEEEPDEWEAREEGGGDTWEFEVRPCAEKLFMDLVINFKELLMQPLLAFFQSVTGADIADVVTKDSVYTAMGLAAAVLHQDFNFDSFLTSTLVNDVQKTGPGYKVLRRRIAILLGQWSPVSIDSANRPLVYQIFQHLLNRGDETNDEVVRITAARQFKAVVDDYNFQVELFLPFASDCLGRLMVLIQEVENTETKLAVLETIRTVAVRMEQHIAPFADSIVSLLPGLWEASGDEHLLKQAILTLLSTLSSSMGEESQRYNTLVLPLIQHAVEPGSEMQIYLLEEALDLWASILAQAPAPASPELIALAEHAFPLLESGSDNLRVVLGIVESYIVLAPEAMLADAVRLRLLSYMTELLGVTKRDLAGLVTSVVEQLIRAAETLGGVEGVRITAGTLNESGYLTKVLEGLRDAWDAHQTSGPNRRYPKLDDVVETDYFTVLARLALGDPNTFFAFLQAEGASRSESVEQTWTWLSTEWFQHFNSMANIERQKLSCLALTHILEMRPLPPCILQKIQDYFVIWTHTIAEMIDGRNGDGGDNLIWPPSEEKEAWEGPEDVRKRKLQEQDPVHRIHTFEYVKLHLQGLAQAVGGGEVFQKEWVDNVDKEVLASFQALSSGGSGN
jgi:hypothetical protein